MKSDTLETPSSQLKKRISEKLSDNDRALEAIKQISRDIFETGLTLEDCCMLADFPHTELLQIMKEVPEVEQYFQMRRIEYKAKLMRIINSQVIAQNDFKTAQSLLALQFADEYDPGVKKAQAKHRKGDGHDVLEKLIRRVQRSAPASPVNEQQTVTDVLEKAERDVYEVSHLININARG